MNTVTDTDTVVLEGLDFQPPCEITYGGLPTECPFAAEWIVVVLGHCSRDRLTTLMCGRHFDYLMGGGSWRCVRCGGGSPMLDDVVSTERLGA